MHCTQFFHIQKKYNLGGWLFGSEYHYFVTDTSGFHITDRPKSPLDTDLGKALYDII